MIVPPMRRRATLTIAASLPLLLSLACGGGRGHPGCTRRCRRPAPSPPTPVPGPRAAQRGPHRGDDPGLGRPRQLRNTAIKTPNLDRLAAEGARFTSFYVPAPSAPRRGPG